LSIFKQLSDDELEPRLVCFDHKRNVLSNPKRSVGVYVLKHASKELLEIKRSRYRIEFVSLIPSPGAELGEVLILEHCENCLYLRIDTLVLREGMELLEAFGPEVRVMCSIGLNFSSDE